MLYHYADHHYVATGHSQHDCTEDHQPHKGEQNGCRQRLEGYLSCQQRLALAVA
jgi:hypothetical protein